MPKIMKNVSLKSFLEGDELMKWLKLVLTNVEFSRLLPVLSCCLSMEQIDELISVKGAEEVNVEEEEDMDKDVDVVDDNTREETIPMYPKVSLGKVPNGESDQEDEEEEAAKSSADDLDNEEDNEQSNDSDEILDHMKDPEEEVPSRAEPERKRRRKSSVTKPVTKSGLQTQRPLKVEKALKKAPMKAEKAPMKAKMAPMKAEKAPMKTEQAPVGQPNVVQECKECSLVFGTDGAKKYHMEAIHSDRKFECPTCQKRFLTLANLTRHSTVHQNEEKYLCNACGKVLKSKPSLDDHTRIHTGEKPFPCPRCLYRGSSSSLLAHHKKRVHNIKTIRTLAFAWET